MHIGIFFREAAAYIHSDGGGSSQSQVEQYHVWAARLYQRPELLFGHGGAYYLRIGYLVSEYLFRTFQFQLHIFYDDDFKFFFFQVEQINM